MIRLNYFHTTFLNIGHNSEATRATAKALGLDIEGIDISHVPAAVHPSPIFQDDAALNKRPNGPPSKKTILEVIKAAKKINSCQVTPSAIFHEFESPFYLKDDEIIGKGNTTVEVLRGASITELQFNADTGQCTTTLESYKSDKPAAVRRTQAISAAAFVPALSIDEVALKFRLSKEQYEPFASFCAHWLGTTAAMMTGAKTDITLQRLSAMLGVGFVVQGKAGTGKTVNFIKPVRDLVNSFGLHGTVITMAFTGIAATSADASTCHSTLGLAMKELLSETTPTEAEIIKWAPVTHILLDEAGTLTGSLLRRIHNKLCTLKKRTDLYFGGVFFVLVMDITQLPPTGGTITSFLCFAQTSTNVRFFFFFKLENTPYLCHQAAI